MRYQFYIDSFLLLTALQNYYAALLLEKLADCRLGSVRRILGAFTGAVLSCVLLFLPGLPGMVKVVAGELLTGLILAGTAARREKRVRFWVLFADFWAGVFLIGGILTALQNLFYLWTGRRLTVPGQILFGALSTALVSFGITLFRRLKGQSIFPVELRQGERQIWLKGLLDSGNSLQEPISGAPVCLMEQSAFEDFLPKAYQEAHPERFRVIPFSSVGKERGLLQGFLVEQVILHRPERCEKKQDVVLAKAPEHMALEGRYQMILHRSFAS